MDLANTLKHYGIDYELREVMKLGGKSIQGITVKSSDEALVVWGKLRPLFETTHRWPIIVGGDTEIGYRHEFYSPDEEHRNERDGASWFEYARSPQYWEDRFRPVIEAYKERGMEIPSFMTKQRQPVKREDPGQAPAKGNPRRAFNADFQDANGPVTIALLPIEHSWQAADYLGFGNFNSCPRASVHSAIHKHWAEQYGAEPVIITHDTIEMWIERPPMTWKAAFELAEDQLLYAEFDQTGGDLNSPRGLATSLLGAKTWYFWWD
ncbi:MAG TPA: DUF4253 domain-containing protein [Planctomycetota bacterium]|nr:DUF4253 domain-containing protein [Planctomycetota bacterium]